MIYLANVENIAIAGVLSIYPLSIPAQTDLRERQGLTIGTLQDLWHQVRFVSMMESGNFELELI